MAQGSINVVKFELKANDTEASRVRKNDNRGKKCALIKVQTSNLVKEERDKIKFQTDAGTEYFTEYDYGEIKLFLTEGCKMLRITHPDYLTCEYRIPVLVEGYKTYLMILEVEKAETAPQKVIMNSAYVKLNVTPSDATVRIDGQIWPDLKKIKLSVDEPHNMLVTHPLYHDYDKVIYASAKEKLTYDVKLAPAYGWINIGSKPEDGAMVYIDGAKKGITPYRSDTLKSGEYEVTLVKDMYESVTKTVMVRDNNTSDVVLQMKPDFAEVTLKTDADADIYVDETRVGRGTWTGRLSGGEHLVEARRESYRPVMKKINMTTGKKETVAIGSPTPVYGGLDITSDPDEVMVYLDDVKIGETPLTKDDVLIGTHTLRFEKKGCTTLEKAVTIEEGKVKELSEKLQTGPTNKTFTVNGVTFEMVAVKGGTFTMGSTDQYAKDDEKITHSVTVGDFMIGKFEVTQRLWKAVMGTNPSHFKGDNLPVENVSWNDCQEFITKLNQKTGANFRLPTEAEWEYAARGGTNTSLYNGENINIKGTNNSSNLDKLAWYGGNCGQNYTSSAGCDVSQGIDISGWSEKQYNDKKGGTHLVGLKQPNVYGLYDMLGNVWEWCQDWYGDYSSGSQINPTGPSSGSHRVFRGGSWYSTAEGCRVSYRKHSTPGYGNIILGFRLAADK